MAAPTIPLYSGIVPNRNQSPSDFADNADDWLVYQAPLAANYNDLATYIDAIAVTIDESAAAAAASAAESAASAQESSNFADLASSASNFKGLWLSLSGALNKPATVEHNGVNWQLLNDLADVTLSEPGVTSDWSEVNPNKVEVQTGGGTLSASIPNEMQDNGTYAIPLASSVAPNHFITVEKADLFKSVQPLLQRSGSDLIEYSGGTDTEFKMNQGNSEKYRFTSNGVDRWRF